VKTIVPGGKVAQWEAMQNQPKRQGRIKFRPPVKTYPMSQIQHGVETLELLDQLDYLTSSQVAKIFFWGETQSKGQPRHLSAAQKAANDMCLRRLKDHGFVEVVPIGHKTSPTSLGRVELNLLTKKGADYLKDLRRNTGSNAPLYWRPGLRLSAPLTFDHALKINDTLANLIGAFRQVGGKVVGVLNDTQLKSSIANGQTYLGDIEPDALLVMRFGDGIRTYLLEVDTGTETLRGTKVNRFERKIERYGEYLTKRFVDDPLFHGLQRPQVLIVTEGQKRAENLVTLIKEHGGRRAYWVTVSQWVTPPDYLATEPVWLVPTMQGYQQLETTA
jgi:hypothetical protein